VNLRVALGQAKAKGLVDAEECARLIRVMKRLYFPERSYEKLMPHAAARIGEERCQTLRRFLVREAADAKSDDAREMLAAMRAAV